jgi:hypothetical protein
MPEERKCPLCGANLRSSNPGPFCTSRECTRAQFAFQAFIASELSRSITRIRIDKVTRDDETVYTIWGRYNTREDKTVELDGVRFNADGIAMGQRFTLGKKGEST